MTNRPPKSPQGFTLVEVMVGSFLSLMILIAVLTCYIFLARNFVRTIGISNAAQPTLAAQARRSMLMFEQDAREAVAITSASASSITLSIPATGDPNTAGTLSSVTYAYNSTAGTLTRTFTPGSTTTPAQPTLILHHCLLTCVFNYYDASGQPYSSYNTYLRAGVKAVAMTITAQTGNSGNGTMTPVYYDATPRILMRNTAWMLAN